MLDWSLTINVHQEVHKVDFIMLLIYNGDVDYDWMDKFKIEKLKKELSVSFDMKDLGLAM